MSGKELGQALVDGFVRKFISRKFLVFIICTVAFFLDKLPANDWTYVAMVYVGVQGLADLPKLNLPFQSNLKP